VDYQAAVDIYNHQMAMQQRKAQEGVLTEQWISLYYLHTDPSKYMPL
jgi:hypothetical protein